MTGALLLMLVGGLLLATVAGYTAANNVPPTRLGDVQARNFVGNDALKAQDMAHRSALPSAAASRSPSYIGGSPGSPSSQSKRSWAGRSTTP